MLFLQANAELKLGKLELLQLIMFFGPFATMLLFLYFYTPYFPLYQRAQARKNLFFSTRLEHATTGTDSASSNSHATPRQSLCQAGLISEPIKARILFNFASIFNSTNLLSERVLGLYFWPDGLEEHTSGPQVQQDRTRFLQIAQEHETERQNFVRAQLEAIEKAELARRTELDRWIAKVRQIEAEYAGSFAETLETMCKLSGFDRFETVAAPGAGVIPESVGPLTEPAVLEGTGKYNPNISIV